MTILLIILQYLHFTILKVYATQCSGLISQTNISLCLLAGWTAGPKEVLFVEVFLANLLGLDISHDGAVNGQGSERFNLHPAHKLNCSLALIEKHLHTVRTKQKRGHARNETRWRIDVEDSP